MKGKQNAAKKRKEPEKPDGHDEQDEPPDEPAAAVAPGARHARRRLLRHRHPVHASLPCPRPVRRAHLCRPRCRHRPRRHRCHDRHRREHHRRELRRRELCGKLALSQYLAIQSSEWYDDTNHTGHLTLHRQRDRLTLWR